MLLGILLKCMGVKVWHGAAGTEADPAGEKKVILREDDFIPKELPRDYDKTFGYNQR
jgi:hypothetical protein